MKVYKKLKNNTHTRVRQASRLSNDIISRRHLPHYYLYKNIIFVTFSTNKIILTDECKDIIFNSIRYWDNIRYDLIACVVMNDHVHLIKKPFEVLSVIMHSIKSFTSHEINMKLNRRGKVWLNESYDRIVRNEDDLNEKINYIINNTIKADIENYLWLYIKEWE